MADNKKMVEAITSRDEDFAKWYTDIVKKPSLLIIQALRDVWLSVLTVMLFGRIYRLTLTEDLKKQVTKMCICLCLSLKAFYRKKRIM